MQGKGAHCFAVDTRKQIAQKTFENVKMDRLFISDNDALFSITSVSMQIGLSEPTGHVLTYVWLSW
jgi:hypothetical protein